MTDLTIAEKQALAILRSGGSYEEASESTHIPVEKLYELWVNHTSPAF